MVQHENHRDGERDATSIPRPSGRIGASQRNEFGSRGLPQPPPSSADIIDTYKRLIALLDREECELARAIAYGLKLLARGDLEDRPKIKRFATKARH